MNHYILTADVYAHWGDVHPVYRVYVNNDLLTERTFIWPGHEVFIRENIEVSLRKGVHKVRIEHINGHGAIEVKNITVNGNASADEFTVD